MHKGLQIIIIVVLSVIAFLLMHYVVGMALQKAALIAGGAGLAMVLFDMVLIPLAKRK